MPIMDKKVLSQIFLWSYSTESLQTFKEAEKLYVILSDEHTLTLFVMESAKSRTWRAWRACMFACFACLRACVLTCLVRLRAYGATWLACLRASVLACLRGRVLLCSRGFFMCLLRWNVLLSYVFACLALAYLRFYLIIYFVCIN